jgi:hypothetical protein
MTLEASYVILAGSLACCIVFVLKGVKMTDVVTTSAISPVFVSLRGDKIRLSITWGGTEILL